MDLKEVLVIVGGAIFFIWVLVWLNGFVGGGNIFKYVFGGAAVGVVVMVLGMGFYYMTQPYYAK